MVFLNLVSPVFSFMVGLIMKAAVLTLPCGLAVIAFESYPAISDLDMGFVIFSQHTLMVSFLVSFLVQMMDSVSPCRELDGNTLFRSESQSSNKVSQSLISSVKS